jgi:hypothetical protein
VTDATTDNSFTLDPDLFGLTFARLLAKLRDTRAAIRNFRDRPDTMTARELFDRTLPEGDVRKCDATGSESTPAQFRAEGESCC